MKIYENYENHYDDARKSLFKNNTHLTDKRDFTTKKPILDKRGNKTKQLTVDFKSVKWNENAFKREKPTVLFKWRASGYTYIEVAYNKLESILEEELLYEVILNGMPRKLFFDWDGKQTKTYISYNEADELACCFKRFLKEIYGIRKDIKCVIQASIEDDFVMKNKDDKCFKSLHFIFNVYTATSTEAKQLITEFMNDKPNKYAPFIDLKSYSNMKLMRALGQRKEDRTDKLQVINKWEFETNKLKQLTLQECGQQKQLPTNMTPYFITAITDSDILLKVEPKAIEKEGVNTIYNIKFNINQLEPLKATIEGLQHEDLHYDNKTHKDKWRYNLHLLISSLLLCGVKWEDILQHEYTQLFLTISKERSFKHEYNNEASYNSNIKLITDICEKKQKPPKVKHKNLFTELTEDEKGFIYRTLNKEPSEEIILTNRHINKRLFLDIYTDDTEYDKKKMTDLILYDTSKYILLVSCSVENKTDKNKNTTTIIATTEQYHFWIDNITRLPKHSFTKEKGVNFTNWDEIITNINESSYYEAPVGSRKSSLRMDRDIRAILTEPYTTNRILMVCDTITLSEAQEARVIQIINSLKPSEIHINEQILNNLIKNKKHKDTRLLLEQLLQSSLKKREIQEQVKHYKAYKRKRTLLNDENTRILITTYDSLDCFKHLNFTHIILDEFINVRKRFTSMSGDNLNKHNQVELFFNILKKADCVKCYDADLHKQDLKLLGKYSDKQFKYYKLNEYTQKNNTIILTNKSRMKNDILKNVMEGKKITISSTTKKEAERVFDWINEAKKDDADFKMVIITGSGNGEDGGAKTNTSRKTDNKLKQSLIRNTALWTEYNVVIYTPTIMTGISYDTIGNFYKHYGFLCSATTDYTQTAQMLFRVRDSITKTIMLCDTSDKINSFYNYGETKDEMKKQFYFETLMINSQNKNSEEIPYYKTAEFKNSLTILQKYEEISNIEERQKKQFYFNLFFTLKKWGCNNMICDFYNYINEVEYEYKRKTDTEYTQKQFIKIDDYDEYLMLDFIDILRGHPADPVSNSGGLKGGNDPFEDNEDDRDKTPSEIKTIQLRKYGYGAVLFNTLNGNKRTNPYFNAVVYDFYTNNSNTKCYDRMKKLTYYHIREIIYDMVKTAYVGITDLQKLFKEQHNLKEQNTLLKWLVNSYVFFKICDFHFEAERDTEDYERSCYKKLTKAILFEKEGNFIITDLKKFEKELEPLMPFITLLVNKKMRDNDTTETTINQAFNYFYCYNSTIGIPPNEYRYIQKTEIIYKRHGITLRSEDYIYYIEKGTHGLTATDYNDIIEWLGGNANAIQEGGEVGSMPLYCGDTPPTPTTSGIAYMSCYDRQIPYMYMPKIKMYNFYSESKDNLRLKHYFNTYFNNKNCEVLTEKLEKSCKEQLEAQEKIDAIKAEELWNAFLKGRGEEEMRGHPADPDLNNKEQPDETINEGEILKKTNIPNYYVSNYGRVFYVERNPAFKTPILLADALKEGVIGGRLPLNKLRVRLNKERLKETFTEINGVVEKQIKIPINSVLINEAVYFVERLVAEAFNVNYRSDFHIKHLNDIYDDDGADNLIMVEKWDKEAYGDIIASAKEKAKENTEQNTKQRRKDKVVCNDCEKPITNYNMKRHKEVCKGKKEPKKKNCEKCGKSILIATAIKHTEKCKGKKPPTENIVLKINADENNTDENINDEINNTDESEGEINDCDNEITHD